MVSRGPEGMLQKGTFCFLSVLKGTAEVSSLLSALYWPPFVVPLPVSLEMTVVEPIGSCSGPTPSYRR